MSFFFIKKMSQNLWATIMPFGPVTNILLAQKKFFVPAKGWPSFQALSSDCSRYENVPFVRDDLCLSCDKSH